MITLSNLVSSILKNGARILKVSQFGTKTAEECGPFGDDGSPIPGMVAVYAETGEIGEPVVIGYLNEKQLAQPGEKRLYSLKENGDLSFYLWLKNDGSCELGGKEDNLVRYSKLSDGLDKTADDINTELSKISAAIALLGGVYTKKNISVDVSECRINELKTL